MSSVELTDMQHAMLHAIKDASPLECARVSLVCNEHEDEAVSELIDLGLVDEFDTWPDSTELRLTHEGEESIDDELDANEIGDV